MVRAKGVTVCVKTPIAWNKMTDKSQQRLRQIVGRDSRIIKAYLGVIRQHEKELTADSKGYRIDESKLHALTLTASRGDSARYSVEHDMKCRFPRTSQNELTECRKAAVSLYESYLALSKKRWRRVSHPCEINSRGRIPRWAFAPRMFDLVQKETSIARWWLNLRDSLDSAMTDRHVHDRLWIPLKVSPFHENQLTRGDMKAAHIFSDKRRKWWVTFAVRLNDVPDPDKSLPPAVLGIDLGIDKAACTVLVTPEKVRETRYFKQEKKARCIEGYDNLINQLQHEKDSRKNRDENYDGLSKKLRTLREKRANVSHEYDKALVRNILTHIEALSEKFTIYVAIGRLKYIRNMARKGNYKGRAFRRMIHSWSFARLTKSFKHQLSQMGWTVEGSKARFQVVPESWTSILCWKCGAKGIRPKQSYFLCTTCGHRTNADRNGAINIAGRLIMLTESLHSVRGLGKWASAVKAARSTQPKARRKKSSQGRSSLQRENQVSDSMKSAAVHHVQLDLLSFGDKAELGDNDHAVAKTVEKLTVSGGDTTGAKQEKEARTAGGIPSH